MKGAFGRIAACAASAVVVMIASIALAEEAEPENTPTAGATDEHEDHPAAPIVAASGHEDHPAAPVVAASEEGEEAAPVLPEAEDAETFSPCDGVTCSDHGTCEVVDGSASCLCHQGFEHDPQVPYQALRALSCVPVESSEDQAERLLSRLETDWVPVTAPPCGEEECPDVAAGDQIAAPFFRHRRRHTAGVVLSVLGSVSGVTGLTLFMVSWGAGPELGWGIGLMAFGAIALTTGIVLAVRGLRGARRLLDVQGRLGMREMREAAPMMPRTYRYHDPAASRRLELAGWVIAAIGTAATVLSAIMLPVNTYGGDIAGAAVLAPLGTLATPVGLIMGLVGSVRRRRAHAAAEVMPLEEPAEAASY